MERVEKEGIKFIIGFRIIPFIVTGISYDNCSRKNWCKDKGPWQWCWRQGAAAVFKNLPGAGAGEMPCREANCRSTRF